MILLMILIAVLLFILINFLLKKFIRTKYKILIAWISTLILTPVIYYIGIIVFFGLLIKEDKLDFNKEQWNSNISVRHKMLDDLIDSEILIGKSKNEVIEILGKPLNISPDENKLVYNMMVPCPGFGVDVCPINLNIQFEKGKAIIIDKK